LILDERPGDLAFNALRHDVRQRQPPRGPHLVATVDRLNRASLALCDRQELDLTIAKSAFAVYRIGWL
jgi:hypothetical protein